MGTVTAVMPRPAIKPRQVAIAVCASSLGKAKNMNLHYPGPGNFTKMTHRTDNLKQSCQKMGHYSTRLCRWVATSGQNVNTRGMPIVSVLSLKGGVGKTSVTFGGWRERPPPAVWPHSLWILTRKATQPRFCAPIPQKRRSPMCSSTRPGLR